MVWWVAAAEFETFYQVHVFGRAEHELNVSLRLPAAAVGGCLFLFFCLFIFFGDAQPPANKDRLV